VTERSPRPGGPDQRDDLPPRPRMEPTKAATLVVAGLATAALSWVLIGRVYGVVPDLPWLPAITLFALAIGESVLARATKARIDRKPGTAPVDPLAVARYVVLAKASALAAAIFAGFYAGILIWLAVERSTTQAGQRDIPPAAAGLAASLALIAGALLLERACRVPKPPDDQQQPD
jgi:hypothetical protein